MNNFLLVVVVVADYNFLQGTRCGPRAGWGAGWGPGLDFLVSSATPPAGASPVDSLMADQVTPPTFHHPRFRAK